MSKSKVIKLNNTVHVKLPEFYTYIINFSILPVSKLCNSISLILIHWGRVMHVCVSKLTITDSFGRHQAIIWTNAVILLIRPIVRNFNEIPIDIHKF